MKVKTNYVKTPIAAKYLGVSIPTVRKYYENGVLAGRKLGRVLLIEKKSLFLEEKKGKNKKRK